MGANIAINYAALHPKKVKAVAMLSPGLSYRHVSTEGPMGKYTGPVYLAAKQPSSGDDYPAQSVLKLAKIHSGRCTVNIYSKPLTGSKTYLIGKKLSKEILDWFTKQLM